LLFGLFGGFCAGLLGIGGGPIYVVIFSIFIPQLYGSQTVDGEIVPLLSDSQMIQLLIANTVFARFFAALAGCWKQYKIDNIYPKTAIAIAIPAAITSLTFIQVLANFEYNKNIFSVIFILLFLPILYNIFTDNANKKKFNRPNKIKLFFLHLTGFISGIVTALSGLGGGFVVIPLLNSWFNIKIRKVISISLNVILIVSASVTFYYLFRFHVDVDIPYLYGAISLSLVTPVIIGILIAAPFGVNVSKKLSTNTLRMLFLTFCIMVISKTAWELVLNLNLI